MGMDSENLLLFLCFKDVASYYRVFCTVNDSVGNVDLSKGSGKGYCNPQRKS